MSANRRTLDTTQYTEHFDFISSKFEQTVNNINNTTPYEILFKEYNKSWVQYCEKSDCQALDPKAFYAKYKPYEPEEKKKRT